MLRWLFNLIAKPKYDLAEPNAPNGWQQSGAWLGWAAPLSIVRGESHYQDALMALTGKPQKDGYVVPVVATIKRELANKYDRNALAVLIGNKKVGYIAKEIAAQLAPTLATGNCQEFQVAAVIRGGYTRRPSFGVYLWPKILITPGPDIDFDETAHDRFDAPSWPPETEEETSASNAEYETKALQLFETAKSKADSKKAGYYKGRRCSDYIESVKALKRAQRFDDAEELLLALIEAVEKENEKTQQGIPSWYYEHLAIIYRQQTNYAKEVEILERYAEQQQHAPGLLAQNLIERLEKARAKQLQAASS